MNSRRTQGEDNQTHSCGTFRSILLRTSIVGWCSRFFCELALQDRESEGQNPDIEDRDNPQDRILRTRLVVRTYSVLTSDRIGITEDRVLQLS